MLVKAIPILQRYLAQLKIIDVHILRQQVSLCVCRVSRRVCCVLCLSVFVCVYGVAATATLIGCCISNTICFIPSVSRVLLASCVMICMARWPHP